MTGAAQKLISYLQGSDKRFVIPVYQRKYDWKIEHCKQLFEDLIKLKSSKSHFFGSIVSYYNSDAEKEEYQIIDGQQRITTISLLLLAMYNLIKNNKLSTESDKLAKKIYNTYLVDEYDEENNGIKLIPVKQDQETYNILFQEDESEFIESAHSTINYRYFYNELQKEKISVDEMYSAISRLEIINIKLNHEDNPQLIFESLNSTGLALSESDKIRNFILMALPTEQQNKYHENYWSKIEKCTGNETSNFIRDYLSVKQQAIPAMSKVYFSFKTYVEDTNIDTESLLKDLLAYAKRYEMLILQKKSPLDILNGCIYRLNRLETTVTRPFFLEVLRLYDEKKINDDDLCEVFAFTENYIFRRTICELPTNSLNKVFLLLHREIVRYEGTEKNYVEKFKYALKSKKEKTRFPDDEEFANAFSKRQVYLMHSKSKIYILERLENANTIEYKNIYDHVDKGDYSIEHIMPQTLTPHWINALGDNYEYIHNEWLHRISNLTLTGYNSSYSNSTFEQKRDMEHGFKESGLKMNVFISQQSKWTLAELEMRDAKLTKQALEIWTYPVTEFKPVEKQFDFCTLEDDVNLSGKIIAKYEFKNTEHVANSWIEMYKGVLSILHTEDKSVLAQLAAGDSADGGLSPYIADDSKKLREALKLDEGIFVESNTSTEMKLSLLRKLFKLYEVEETDLIFYFKGTDGGNKEQGTLYEIRRNYWSYALPIIQNAHRDTGCFSGWTSTKNNWINGFFGISGFAITVVSNYGKVKVELNLSSNYREKNKQAYDYLFSQKSEIEQKLGTPLKWERSDENKSSYVIYELTDVSIGEETDWILMAKFQAEWSKKFYDVFVPVLQEFNKGYKKV